jgi:serine/threonine protein phosphatase 1
MSTARTYVVGDIHGCVDELNYLLDAIGPGPDDTICFLGDYVDRGPSAKGVIERLIRLRSEGPRCIFLKGNHEDMFLAYLGYPGHYADAFLFNGGETTITSYGIQGSRGQAAAERLPPAHLDFLVRLESQARLGDYLCVHAGVRPSQPLTEQSDEDLFWIREDFILSEHPFPVTVLFGHTPQREVLLHLPFKIGLDTGLVYWNKLSCLELVQGDLFQLRRGERRVQRTSLARELEQARVPVT